MGINHICATIINKNTNTTELASMVDLFEVRIDLIGNDWQKIASHLPKPWIACNRLKEEDGNWNDSEARRKEELLKAIGAGASIVDIELATTDLGKLVPVIKRKAKCLISSHNFKETPPFDKLKSIVSRQLDSGADICKVITFAKRPEDNLTILRLIPEFPETRIIAFAMGELGLSSRILCPLVGGDFTYAAIEKGAESAPGQITVTELSKIYQMMKNNDI